MGFVVLYVTCKDKEEAEKISSELLNKRLIACVNFLPIQSSFWWKGKIDTSDEIVALLKTKKENWKKVEEEVRKIHSYETPCIMKFDVEANKDYEKWINKVTGV